MFDLGGVQITELDLRIACFRVGRGDLRAPKVVLACRLRFA